MREITKYELELRQALKENWENNPKSIASLAKEIEISYVTLRRFLIDGLKIDYMVQNKIKNYLNKQTS